MKYTTEQALLEILRRRDRVLVRRTRRACQILSGVCSVLLVSLTAVIAVLPQQHALNRKETVYGAFLLSSEACGYVLTAVLAFAAGSAVTLLCAHLAKLQERRKTYGQNKENQEN